MDPTTPIDPTPPIDVAEPERIDALIAAPDTVSFRADAAENLDGLVPDVGLTGAYPYRSVYRPRSFARAGLPAVLRHRFWDTIDGADDHTGRRYVGVVMYDEYGLDCRLEVTLGADPLGCMVPFRHDNRRHLYVLDRAVEFMGEMEVLRIVGAGNASYRLERVALLRERPEPTCYRPRIDRLTARLRRSAGGTFTVAVDATTRPAARCQVTVTRADTGQTAAAAEEAEPLSLHSIEAAGLPAPPAAGYRAQVRATEAGGLQETAEVTVAGGPAGVTAGEGVTVAEGAESAAGAAGIATAAGPVTVPVELCNLAGAELRGLPVTFGAPVPRGRLTGAVEGRWEIGGASAPVQCRPHGFWPDGSASWVLIDGCPPQPAASGERLAGAVTLSPAADAPQPAGGVPPVSAANGESGCSPAPAGLRCAAGEGAVSVTGDSLRVRVAAGADEPLPAVETRAGGGPWRAVCAGSSAAIALGGGVDLRQGPVYDLCLEEQGWQRAVIRYRYAHLDADGTAHLVSTVRIHVYRGLQAVRIVHRLQVSSPHLPPAAGGGVDDIPAHAAAVRGAIAGADGEQATLLTVRSASLTVRRAADDPARWRRAGWPGGPAGGAAVPAAGAVRLIHDHDQGHRVEDGGGAREAAGRVAGHVTVSTGGEPGKPPAETLTAALRRFWQTWPRAVRVTGGAVAVELLPAPDGAERPGDEESWHRTDFWLRGDGYLLKAGMALTSELLLAFGPRDDALLAWFEDPPAVRPALDWLNGCGALGPLAAKDTGLLAGYERAVDGGYEQWMADRDVRRQYGWINFGDWYGESVWSWGNNEYDPPFAHYCEFLRGGDPRWSGLAAEAARHLADVDTVNSSANPDQVGAQYTHMPGHAGGYLPPYFRSKMSGSSSAPSHTWVEGPALHYLLTGDRNVRDSLDRTAGWLLGAGLKDFGGGIQHYDFANCRECGWHLIHLTALARMSESPRYLNAASLIVARVLERQEPGGGWERVLKAGHCGCQPPRERGEAGFMVGVLLSGLRRYHELTGDERVAEAIRGGARWLLRRTYDAASGHFRYTPCLRRGGGPQPVYTRQVVEGLAYAHALTGDAELRQIVERGLRDLSDLPAASADADHAGFGKDWASQTRYVPSLLAYLSRPAER